MVTSSKDKGGIQIGSLVAFYLVLLLKWRRRYVHETYSLFLIFNLHGSQLKDLFDVSVGRGGGVWARIVGSINLVHEKGIVPLFSLKKCVGDGINTKFWFDIWLGEITLKLQFQRLLILEYVKHCIVQDRLGGGYNWSWTHQITSGVLQPQLDELLWLIGNFQTSNKRDC